ncbi:MAG TPA: oxidoreductase, partial [Candidatus Binatia bacterium]|nr:oxidoreductase [Candidatus Binatia bacterium]
MNSFRALRIHESGKATSARLDTIPLDELSAGEVVVRVQWSGINYKDALAVTGKGRIMRRFP